ncbi:hypothetical protein RIF29_20886 [Crotalaria pallida]|uniref:Pentatricopeptide repeat-containing protein n=1 Tax=Crotalaria pallida TaxID=3830 RepID=A0AAN9I923_CROPI
MSSSWTQFKKLQILDYGINTMAKKNEQATVCQSSKEGKGIKGTQETQKATSKNTIPTPAPKEKDIQGEIPQKNPFLEPPVEANRSNVHEVTPPPAMWYQSSQEASNVVGKDVNRVYMNTLTSRGGRGALVFQSFPQNKQKMRLPRLRGALSFFSHSATEYASFSSSSTLNLATAKKPSGVVSSLRKCFPTVPFDVLYRRISPAGDPAVSMVPILEQWVKEGGDATPSGLSSIIKYLRTHRRFSHALEICAWMFEKKSFALGPKDFALRLDLIARVNGIEEAESYFDTIPNDLRTQYCFNTLLNCYIRVKDVYKAENIMQKMIELGSESASLSKNYLLNLYYQTQNYEKLKNLVHEMQEEGINLNKYTFGIMISAYAATSNTEGIDGLLEKLKSDPSLCLNPDWNTYSIAANAYRKCGLFDKAFYFLKKSEELITYKTGKTALSFLMTQYAAIGKKEEVMRLWNLYKKDGKIYNTGFLSVMASVLKFDDLASAEKIFEEWESAKMSFDVRIPNLMIAAYSRKGLLEAAETVVNRTFMNGGKPNSKTWYYLSSGYLEQNNFLKAIEYMKDAISISEVGSGWAPFPDSLAVILEHLKAKGDEEGAEELTRLLRNKDLVSLEVHNRLMNWITDKASSTRVIDLLEGDSNSHTNEASELEEDRNKKDFCLHD